MRILRVSFFQIDRCAPEFILIFGFFMSLNGQNPPSQKDEI